MHDFDCSTCPLKNLCLKHYGDDVCPPCDQGCQNILGLRCRLGSVCREHLLNTTPDCARRRSKAKSSPARIPGLEPVLNLLQTAHDDADHIIGTQARYHKEVAIKDARSIRNLIKQAIKKLQ